MIKKIFFGGIASVVLILSVMLMNILQSRLAIQYLLDIESGVWFLLLNIFTVASFCDFGLSATLSREIGFASKKMNPIFRISNLLCTTKRLLYFSALALSFFLFAFGYLYFAHLSVNAARMSRILQAFGCFSIAILIRIQANPYLAILYGSGKVALERYIRAIGPLVTILVGWILVAYEGCGLIGLTISYVFQAVLIYGLARYFLKRNIKIHLHGKFIPQIAKRMFKPAIQWTIMNIGSILILQTSNFIIAYIMGIQHVSEFAILMQISTAILAVSGMINMVITPFVTMAYSVKNLTQIQIFLNFSVKVSTALALVLALFCYFFIEPIKTIWIGKNFYVYKDALIFLMITTVLEVHHVSIASIAMATGYVKFAGTAIIAGILNIFFSFILISYLGILGAALGIFLSQLMTNNWYAIWISAKHLQYEIKQYLFKTTMPLLLFTACIWFLIIGIKLLLSSYLNTHSPIMLLVLAMTICGLAALLSGWLILLSKDEKQIIKIRLRKVIYA